LRVVVRLIRPAFGSLASPVVELAAHLKTNTARFSVRPLLDVRRFAIVRTETGKAGSSAVAKAAWNAGAIGDD